MNIWYDIIYILLYEETIYKHITTNNVNSVYVCCYWNIVRTNKVSFSFIKSRENLSKYYFNEMKWKGEGKKEKPEELEND